MRFNSIFLLATSSLAAIALSAPAYADDTPTAAPAADAASNEIVVTGTRVANRTKLDTVAPVDVLTANELRQQGTPELGTALANLVPSLDFPRPSGNDGSDAIRPAELRGLSPDETLVLINGVRAHASAYLNVNGALGRGSAAVDLNTIPEVALESVEVLRDGASAQYGSDAIAGVVNLRLREADHGGGATASTGIYATDFSTAHTTNRSSTGEPVTTASAWQGIKLGSDGFLTISGDYQHRSATNRADLDYRPTIATPPGPPLANGVYGDPKVNQYSGWANFGKPVSGDWQLYGWAGYQYRDSTSAEFPRLAPAAATAGLGAVYPNGFLPLLNSHSFDLNTALGVKGDVSGWKVDAKVSYGRNEVKLNVLDSANYTLGATSPTSFYAGKFTYGQTIGQVDASKSLPVFKSLNVAWGAEVRHETYSIGSGDFDSYTGTGSQGYTGLSNFDNINVHRTSESAYLDLEAQITDQLRLGAAGRYEHYSDFGSTGTGKVSVRYDISPNFALRATGSTGFRAPSLQEEYYTSIASQLVFVSLAQPSVLEQVGTFPATSAAAEALGGKPLQPERAASASAGFVARSGGFDLTVDGYYTHVRNGIALSESLPFPQPNAENVQAAHFFINGIGITSKGIDAVAHYKLRTDGAGTFDFTVASNVNKISVTNVPGLPAVSNPLTLFGRQRIIDIEDGTPGDKVSGTVEWSHGKLGATARVTYYGNVTVGGTPADGSQDYSTGSHAITDLELRYQPKETALNLAIGANNLFDVYPRAVPANLVGNTDGVVAFPYYSPFGFNGRFVYIRAGLHW